MSASLVDNSVLRGQGPAIRPPRRERFRGEFVSTKFRIQIEPNKEDRGIIRWWRGSRTWLVSGAVHAVVVVVLGLITASIDATGPKHYLTVDSGPRMDNADLANLVPSILAPSQTGSSAQHGSTGADDRAKGAPVLGSLPTIEVALSGDLGKGAASGDADDLRMLTGPEGIGLQEFGQQVGTAKFFGLQASGNEFVFVVDSSRSMDESRKWSRATTELLESVERLGKNQTFCVFFFDRDVHLMFNEKASKLAMVPATERNKTKLRRWIKSISFGGDTRPLSSMRFALNMKPDAVFLLSDGEFHDDTVSFLRAANLVRDDDGETHAKTVIHTICFQSEAGRTTLEVIAKDHAGTFRFVR